MKDFCRSISTESIPKKLDFTKLKSKFKEPSTTYHHVNLKTERKSSEDVEIGKMSSSPYLKKNYYTDAVKKEGSTTTTIRKNTNMHGHVRSVSDRKLLASKREPSR